MKIIYSRKLIHIAERINYVKQKVQGGFVETLLYVHPQGTASLKLENAIQKKCNAWINVSGYYYVIETDEYTTLNKFIFLIKDFIEAAAKEPIAIKRTPLSLAQVNQILINMQK
ncbi:hypothetical protein EON78_01450 [bacterium]|nr:MAG: hypothetical protein EON78_01450 [bacterium]